MTHKEIQPGDLVKLSKISPFCATANFPVEGTEFECIGVVAEVNIIQRGSTFEKRAFVQWGNGTSRDYSTTWLKVIDDSEIPKTKVTTKDRNRYISIWKD